MAAWTPRDKPRRNQTLLGADLCCNRRKDDPSFLMLTANIMSPGVDVGFSCYFDFSVSRVVARNASSFVLIARLFGITFSKRENRTGRLRLV